MQSYFLLIHTFSSLISDICVSDNNNNPENRDPESFKENVSQLKAALVLLVNPIMFRTSFDGFSVSLFNVFLLELFSSTVRSTLSGHCKDS